MAQAFPTLLKYWRSARRMSQLELGLAANVSARHVSFLETGRAKPSRMMVRQLCETLDVPLHARNGLLKAAGFAEAYQARALDDAELAPARDALEWVLERHDPYPAMAIDRHWRVVKANHSATELLSAVGLKAGDSLLQAMETSERLRNAIVNWTEVAAHMVNRLRTESAYLGGDETLATAAQALALQLQQLEEPPNADAAVVLLTRYKLGPLEFSLFSMMAQFGSTDDIALADLKIELMFPADKATKSFLLSRPEPS
jgi:transcriptional regulator with XRE-family HTH domain